MSASASASTSGRARPSWTLCQDPSADARVSHDLSAIGRALTARLGADLRALLLVGSYGRGEGGVAMHGASLGPYNDYDLVAIVPRDTPEIRTELTRFADEWTALLNVHVEVWPFEERRLAAVPPTLFWLDVSLGGVRVLAGDPGVDAALHAIRPRDVPLSECGRLLANRAVGIALSNLEGPAATDESLARHIHKSALACGDARLLTADRYAPTMRQRLDALERLVGGPSVGPELVDAYRQAVLYRSRPDAWAPPDGLTKRAWYAQMRDKIAAWHLAFEAWRVGAPASPRAFAGFRGVLYEALPDVRRAGSLPAALRATLKRKAPLLPYVGHPRERLARVAVALAYGPDDPGARDEAARLLGVPGKGLDRASSAELLPRLRALSELAG